MVGLAIGRSEEGSGFTACQVFCYSIKDCTSVFVLSLGLQGSEPSLMYWRADCACACLQQAQFALLVKGGVEATNGVVVVLCAYAPTNSVGGAKG